MIRDEMNWRSYSYLKSGTDSQRQAYDIVNNLNILAILKKFDPALVSTVCVNLDTPESDLDIICQVTSYSRSKSTVKYHFGNQPNFKIWERSNGETVIKFDTDTFPVEIFGAKLPIEKQNAWRHLNMMQRVLEIEPKLRNRVIELKGKGLATEEAFARLLSLEGDPYEAFLSLEKKSDKEIRYMCQGPIT